MGAVLRRIDEPAVGEPVDELRRTEVVAVDLGLPAAVVALAEDEPERLGARSGTRPSADARSQSVTVSVGVRPGARAERRRGTRPARRRRPCASDSRTNWLTDSPAVRGARGAQLVRARRRAPPGAASQDSTGSGWPSSAAAVVPVDAHAAVDAVDAHDVGRDTSDGISAGSGGRSTPGDPGLGDARPAA